MKETKDKIVIPKFSSSCEHCLKIFKNSKLYDKHVKEQLCYKDNELTYCKLCLLSYENHNEYKIHLFSLEHINNIGCDTIEKIEQDNKSSNITKNNSKIHTLDPYLNANDVKKISNNNLGDSFTFVYEKGNTQTITLKPIIKKYNTNSVENTVENTVTIPNTFNTIQEPTLQEPTLQEPTIRQSKIINFLESQILKTSIVDSGNKFYKMLDNKLQLEDYKGLQIIVTNLKINEEYKLNYLKTIDIFINYLIKETTMGKTIYKDKEISQLVINLTS